MLKYRHFMQAEIIGTIHALHEDQHRHILALHEDQHRHILALHESQHRHILALHNDLYRHCFTMYEEQLKLNKALTGPEGFGDLARSVEAALLTLALHFDEMNRDQMSSSRISQSPLV